MVGDVGVVMLKSLRRLMRSSRAYDVVWVMGSSNYSVLSNQLYQSRTPKVDRGGCRMLSKNVLPVLLNTDHCLKYVDGYRRGPE